MAASATPAVGVDTDRNVRVGTSLAAFPVWAFGTDDHPGSSVFVELPADVYKLVFHPRSPFFRGIEVEVELGDGHYHVPLLLAPYSCAIYRGS